MARKVPGSIPVPWMNFRLGFRCVSSKILGEKKKRILFIITPGVRSCIDISTFSYWLKALSQMQDKEVRNDYIKLMTLALQHPEPVCPFKDPPPEKIDPLEYGVKKKFK